MTIRPPEANDAVPIWRLVRQAGSLDPNSPYAYLLLCTDFAACGAVAVADDKTGDKTGDKTEDKTEDEIMGFVLGYRPPTRPEAWFIWQVAVQDRHRQGGVARALLAHVLERLAPQGVTHLEATVTPSNTASRALLDSLARQRGARSSERLAFPSPLFPDGKHEDELLIRVGPLAPEAQQAQ